MNELFYFLIGSLYGFPLFLVTLILHSGDSYID